MILHAPGTNRDRDIALACQMAGGDPEIVHINQLAAGSKSLEAYQMLVVPGGFSYGDDLGAGRLWATDLVHRFRAQLDAFVAAGKPVLGICNGFQTLVKAGYLPGPAPEQRVTLTNNVSAKFECRWVRLRPAANSRSLFTAGMEEDIFCPVAHGEGRLVAPDEAALQALSDKGLVALYYVTEDGASPAGYPANPSGSQSDIAGICNAAGNVMGLMPHPENHIIAQQHPRWTAGASGNRGLVLFSNGVRAAAQFI